MVELKLLHVIERGHKLQAYTENVTALINTALELEGSIP